uniref:ANK_REP_REGION domain-containing protein n=1 Tax=Gongylonema pulchrum TaxID=637853 RepID=A0A183ESQ7_9BILA
LGETPLHCAVLRNDLTQIIALLAGNADVDIADNDGNTPLHIAAQVGYVIKKKKNFPKNFVMFIIFGIFIA